MQSRHIRFDLNFYCCFWWMRKQFLETGQWGDYNITNKHALPISLWSIMLLLEWSKPLSSTESDICPQEIREKVSWRLKRRIVVVVQSINRVWLFATQWTAAHQASLSFTISQSLLILMCIESVMPSKHLILCRPLLLPSIFPSITVFSNESALHIRGPKYWRKEWQATSVFLSWEPHERTYWKKQNKKLI